MDANLNINSTACLAQTSDFGGTTVVNVCSGIRTFVAWGSIDWTWAVVGCVFAAALIAILLAFFGRMAWYILTEKD